MTLDIKLDQYTLIEEIGRGGFGTVYRAVDETLQVERAVKVLHPALVADPSFIERFREEARLVARLKHPHILSVYALGEDQGRFYLVMDYIPGGSLKDLLAEDGPLPFARALEVLMQIASALDYAHGQNLVHRDVKPGNILLDAQGNAYLTDFGFAKSLAAADSSTTMSLTGGILGTPAYMAPEAWDGQGWTSAADVYSLACVFFEMLMGKPLFDGESPTQLMKQHIIEGPQFSEVWPHGTPIALNACLEKALNSEPAARFPNAGRFQEELETLGQLQLVPIGEAVTSTEPVTPRHIDVLTDSPVPSRRRPGWKLLRIFVALIVLVGVGVGFGVGRCTLPPQSSLTITSMADALGVDRPIDTLTPATEIAKVGVSATVELIGTPIPLLEDTPITKHKPEAGDTQISPVDGMVMAYVQEGIFVMGSDGGDSDEIPVHSVYLDMYWLDQTEVTNLMYELCVLDGKCSLPSETGNYYNDQYLNYPIVFVNWFQAQTYCTWAGRRLPTEAEWEKAARGDDERIYPWGENIDCSLSNYKNCVGQLVAVGQYPDGASPYNILDMAGNVREWVGDWYGSDYYLNTPSNNPSGPLTGNYHVVRGGSWNIYGHHGRTASRSYEDPWVTNNYLGFRCAMDASTEG
jgi:eukaryotic-like serine/threonine-protein kinase